MSLIQDYINDPYEMSFTGDAVVDVCSGCGSYSQEDIEAEYTRGFNDGIGFVAAGGCYTQEQVDQIVSDILTWGDTDGDGKIDLKEAVKALQVTVGQ